MRLNLQFYGAFLSAFANSTAKLFHEKNAKVLSDVQSKFFLLNNCKKSEIRAVDQVHIHCLYLLLCRVAICSKQCDQ